MADNNGNAAMQVMGQIPGQQDIGSFLSNMFKTAASTSKVDDATQAMNAATTAANAAKQQTPSKVAGGSTTQTDTSANTPGIGDVVTGLLKNVGGSVVQGAQDIGSIVEQLAALL